MAPGPVLARRMWRLLEPCHGIVYFADEARSAYAAAGLKGGWMGYFASRSAAMGAVGPGVVTASFYVFAPAMVGRAIPDAWRFSTPERVLEARRSIADAALRRLLGDDAVHSPAMREAAALVRRAAETPAPAGRPLYAAHAELEWPAEPHLAFWHGATLLREYRGDGHAAALTAADVGGCDALVMMDATRRAPRAALQPFRGWSDEEWETASARLEERGWIDAHGRATRRGARARDEIEDATDRASLSAWAALDDGEAEVLASHAEAFAALIFRGRGIPFPNPIGVPRPAAPQA